MLFIVSFALEGFSSDFLESKPKINLCIFWPIYGISLPSWQHNNKWQMREKYSEDQVKWIIGLKDYFEGEMQEFCTDGSLEASDLWSSEKVHGCFLHEDGT